MEGAVSHILFVLTSANCKARLGATLRAAGDKVRGTHPHRPLARVLADLDLEGVCAVVIGAGGSRCRLLVGQGQVKLDIGRRNRRSMNRERGACAHPHYQPSLDAGRTQQYIGKAEERAGRAVSAGLKDELWV